MWERITRMPRFNGGPGGTGRKHHKQKRGITSKSHYPDRLAARGVTSKSVHMRTIEDLRKRADRRDAEQETDDE
jgi:hypothetical protein